MDTKVEVGGASTSEGQPTALATSARRLPLLQAVGSRPNKIAKVTGLLPLIEITTIILPITY